MSRSAGRAGRGRIRRLASWIAVGGALFGPAGPPAFGGERAKAEGRALRILEIRWPGPSLGGRDPGEGIVTVLNGGDLPLDGVRLSIVTRPEATVSVGDAGPARLESGERRSYRLRGTPEAVQTARVVVADEKGWALASRTFHEIGGDAAPQSDYALTAFAPRNVVAGRAFDVDFRVLRTGSGDPDGKLRAVNAHLSVSLPDGLQVVDGEANTVIALREALPDEAGPQGPHVRDERRLRVRAERAGTHRVRAIVREEGGHAAAGVFLDLVVLPEEERRPDETEDSEADRVDVDHDLPLEEAFGPDEAGGAFGDWDGGKTARDAAARALAWLAAHQSPDGGWKCADFGRWCRGAAASESLEGAGDPMHDVGVTGLALYAFLRAGHTHLGIHEFAGVVSKGLRYLKRVQDTEGCFGPRTTTHYVYGHATASLAMVEAYRMTRSPILEGSTQRALDFISLARNPYFAWRYGVKPGDNDTSVTCWMGMALDRARGVPGLRIDEEAYPGIRAWVEKVTDPDHGRAGYLVRGSGSARPADQLDSFPADRSEAMTAAALLLRGMLGETRETTRLVRSGLSLLHGLPPRWDVSDGSLDFVYWHFGARAFEVLGGPERRSWNAALIRALVPSQRRGTDPCGYLGSWDPIDVWGRAGGRVYATALGALALTSAASPGAGVPGLGR